MLVKNIPLVDLRAQYRPLQQPILEGIAKVLDGMHLFLGENVQSFEKEFATYCQTEFAYGVSEGTTALQLALMALEVGSGDEVITTSHTFFATTEAICLIGATPVFVDVNSDTLLMDVSAIEEKITPRTKAIITVHLYGQTVDLDPVVALAKKHGLKIVEDAAQAHGARYKGRLAGGLGDVGCFSFYYSKNLGAYGEGGAVTTNNPEIARKLRMLRDHGSEIRYHHELIGMNGRLDELQAVILRVKLPYLDSWNDRRRQLADLYSEALKDAPVKTPSVMEGNLPVYHLYVIEADRRDDLQAFLRERGIGTGIHYPIPCHLQKPFTASSQSPTPRLSVTEAACKRILSLPIYPEMEESDVTYVAESVKDFYRGARQGE